jgi:SulP family sulfate permease
VGGVALVAILTLRFVAPRVPGALVLVIGGLLASRVLDLAERGVSTVGEVPRGVPSPTLPAADIVVDNLPTILVASFAVLLIGFSQTAGDARLFAARHGYRIDVDNETVAQGIANVGSGILQGIPVSTSLSASSLNDSSGARSQMASVVTGAVVVLTLILFAPLFSDLPKPVLAAIIIDAVVFGMMDIGELRRLRRVARADFFIALAAIVGVLSSGVLAGVIIGIVLSLGWLVHVNMGPATPELGREPGTTTYRPLDEHPDDETFAGVFVLRFDGGLFFVTTEVLSDRVRDHVTEATEPVEHIVLDCEAVNFVDSQGVGELHRLVTIADERGVDVHFARVQPHLRDMLVAEGVVQALGAAHFHTSVDGAVNAARSTTRPS